MKKNNPPTSGVNFKALAREKKKFKAQYGPTGGTFAGEAKRAEINKGYDRVSKRKIRIKIVDKTK